MVTKAKGSAALFWYCSQGAASLLHPLAQRVLTIATTLRKISHQLEAQKAAPEEICRDSVCSYIFKVKSLPVRDTSQHFHFFWVSNLLKQTWQIVWATFRKSVANQKSNDVNYPLEVCLPASTDHALFASHLPLQNLKLLESGRVGQTANHRRKTRTIHN